jgi:rubredoxin
MKKFFCTLCEYVFDPSEGDPVNGIPPHTSFADLLDTWICPNCFAGKSQFKRWEKEPSDFGRPRKHFGEGRRGFPVPEKKAG